MRERERTGYVGRKDSEHCMIKLALSALFS